MTQAKGEFIGKRIGMPGIVVLVWIKGRVTALDDEVRHDAIPLETRVE